MRSACVRTWPGRLPYGISPPVIDEKKRRTGVGAGIGCWAAAVGSDSLAKLRWRNRGTTGGGEPGLLRWFTDRFWAAWTTELKIDDDGEEDVSRHGGLRRFSSLKMSPSVEGRGKKEREISVERYNYNKVYGFVIIIMIP